MVAAMLVREEAARAVIGPFHRAAQGAGGMQQAGIFRIGAGLHAEAAADIAGQHAEFLGLHAHDAGHLRPQAKHTLAADMQRPAPILPFADRSARLHGADHDAGIADIEAGDMRGRGKGLRHLGAITEMEIEDAIIGDVVIQRRCGTSGTRLRHRIEGFDVEFHHLRRVARRHATIGHHEGHRVTHEAHAVGRQRRAGGVAKGRAILALQGQRAAHGAVAGQIGRGVDAQHARHGAGGSGVDALDQPMRIGAADHHGIDLAGAGKVIGVTALALQQDRVLLAGD